MKRLFLGLIFTIALSAQVGPVVNSSTLTYFGFHTVTDVAPEAYVFPNSFIIKPPQLPSYLPYKTLLDINTIRIYVNGKALTNKLVPGETEQTVDYQYLFGGSTQSAIVFLSGNVFHLGDRVRVDFGYLELQ